MSSEREEGRCERGDSEWEGREEKDVYPIGEPSGSDKFSSDEEGLSAMLV